MKNTLQVVLKQSCDTPISSQLLEWDWMKLSVWIWWTWLILVLGSFAISIVEKNEWASLSIEHCKSVNSLCELNRVSKVKGVVQVVHICKPVSFWQQTLNLMYFPYGVVGWIVCLRRTSRRDYFPKGLQNDVSKCLVLLDVVLQTRPCLEQPHIRNI